MNNFPLGMLNDLHAVIVMVDADMKITWINEIGARNYERFGGREIIGRSLLDCHQPENHGRIQMLFEDFRTQKLPGLAMERLLEDRRKHIAYLPSYEDGKFSGCLEIQYFSLS